MPLLVRPFEREEIAAKLDAVAELRIKVFAEFPYLYAGDLEYERNYLEVYLESAGAIIVGAWRGTGSSERPRERRWRITPTASRSTTPFPAAGLP